MPPKIDQEEYTRLHDEYIALVESGAPRAERQAANARLESIEEFEITEDSAEIARIISLAGYPVRSKLVPAGMGVISELESLDRQEIIAVAQVFIEGKRELQDYLEDLAIVDNGFRAAIREQAKLRQAKAGG